MFLEFSGCQDLFHVHNYHFRVLWRGKMVELWMAWLNWGAVLLILIVLCACLYWCVPSCSAISVSGVHACLTDTVFRGAFVVTLLLVRVLGCCSVVGL